MIEIKPLLYDYNALQPVVSAETMHFHHDKHYAGYVEKANILIPKEWEKKSLAEIVALAYETGDVPLFNQVAQAWNHEFFFEGLKIDPFQLKITDRLNTLIVQDFGNLETLKAELVNSAISLFGSGWVWLVLEKGKLKVMHTSNAETPLVWADCTPLWTLDVWEHAYYLDHQNRRQEYASALVNRAINWQVVSDKLSL